MFKAPWQEDFVQEYGAQRETPVIDYLPIQLLISIIWPVCAEHITKMQPALIESAGHLGD